MKKISLLIAAIGAAIATTGCERSPTQETTPAPQGSDGRLSLQVRTGSIGVLARSATMTPRRIVFAFTSGTDLTRRDTMSLLSGAQIVRDFRLTAGRTWHLTATGLDAKDSVLYSGSADFPIGADSTTNLSMSLDALHSSLQLSIPAKEGAKRLQASLDGRPWLDSTLGSFVRENDTIRAERDYLAASRTGTAHSLSIRISGNRGDKDTVLYALDTNLTVVTGQNQGLRLTLKWVGPPPTKYGATFLTATLGSVGILKFEVDYGRAQEFGCREWKDGSGIPWNGTISYGILCDERDSQAYRTVRMGSQVWMAQDLNYAGADGNLGSCYVESERTCQFSGRRYTWVQATMAPDTFLNAYWPGETTRQNGICPADWHIPQADEWKTLQSWVAANAVGDPKAALRSVEGWDAGTIRGTDQFGFHALPYRRDADQVVWWTLDRSSDPVFRPESGTVFDIDGIARTAKSNRNTLRCVHD